MRFENNRIYDEFGAQRLKENVQQPYRSEMNLILSFDGAKPTFTEDKNDDQQEMSAGPKDLSESLETPPPKVPFAMSLLPSTLPYIKNSDKQTPTSDMKTPTPVDNIKQSDGVAIPLPPNNHPTKDKSAAKSNNGKTATVRRHFFSHKTNPSNIKIIVDDTKESSIEEDSKHSPDKTMATLAIPVETSNLPECNPLHTDTVSVCVCVCGDTVPNQKLYNKRKRLMGAVFSIDNFS